MNDDRAPDGRARTDPLNPTRLGAVLADGGFDGDFFRSVVERVGVGVAVYEESGRFAYVNEAFAEMLERTPEDLVGSPIWAVNPDLEAERFDEYWRSFAVGETRNHEGTLQAAGGELIHVETVTTAIEVDGSRYHIGTIEDIRRRVEQREAARRQDERIEEFASVVSHDLRNPLNVAMGRLELIDADCDSEHTEHVERSLERMEALIDDVLTLAREGSRLTDPEPVDIAEAVRTAWHTSGAGSATLELDGDLGRVSSEESRLCQIFENLFGNALDHAGETVTVTVGRSPNGFYVADDGPGIPEDEREAVFEYGYSETREGTGFGLTIVQQIAEAHGWTVELTASEAGGARFEFQDVSFVGEEERA